MRADQEPIPQNAAPASAPDNASEKQMWRGGYEDFSGSLGSYLKDIGNLPLLSPQEQAGLGAKIDSAATRLREIIGGFGFVAREVIRLVDRCLDGDDDPSDHFMPSGLRGENGNVKPDLLVLFADWKTRIGAALTQLDQALSAHQDHTAARREMTRILLEYHATGDTVNEWCDVLFNYAEMLPGAPPDTRAVLEQKLLLPLDELPNQMQELRRQQEHLETLRQEMVESNLRLVISIAQKHRNRGIPFNDLIQEGNLGLLRAIERFDFRMGNRFSTYASWWVRHNIIHAISEQGRIIRIPAHMIAAVNSINWCEQRFIQNHGREPELTELAAALEMPVSRVSALKKMQFQMVSLQAHVGNDESNTMLEGLIADRSVSDPTQELSRKILYDNLYKLLSQLSERDQQIIILRFGLFGNAPQPLSEVSKHVHLTRERVRQLENKILGLMRSPANRQLLDGGLF